MSFERTSAELVKNTSTVSPTTLPTVKDALDNLQGRTPIAIPVPISEGGTGQTTKTAAFNALSPQTTRGDLITRDATNDVRLPLGATGTLLRSDGTDPVYSTFSAYLDAIFTGEANGDLIQRSAGTWTNVTVPTMLATLLTARGQIIRRGASAPEALAAQTADTFLGGDGTDVTTRTATQVRASLSLVTGTYSPTGTIVANLDSITMYGGSGYVRVNDIVVVAGAVLADATAAGGTATSLGVSVPVASNFGGVVQCTGVVGGPLGMVGTITADVANDRAQMDWASQSTAAQTLTYIFLYRII